MIEAIIILLLILLNGFFSSAEIAIVSARKSVIDRLVKEGVASARIVSRMKEDPERFLATVQMGVTVVGTLASVIGGVAAIEFLKPLIASIPIGIVQQSAEVLSVGLVAIIISYAILVVGELVPKSIALRYAERIACFSAKPLDTLSRISSIFVGFLSLSTKFVLRILNIKDVEKRFFVSEEEIKYFISEGRAKGIFEETKADLLHGVFEFADTTVKEVMVPKPKFSGIEINTPPDRVLKFIAEKGFSRYPVYRENLDNIVGILFNKDVFRTIESGRPLNIRELLRPPYFVPNTIKISRLLREMQRRKVHIAIVVDEHGDVDGLVTIEDILEEIVGEIEDEYDVEKEGLVERLRDGTMIIDAAASLRDLEDLGIEFGEESGEYNTLAGFMLARLQRIPRGGEFVIHNGYRFTVVDVEENRIVKVKAEALSPKTKKRATA